MKIFHPWAAAIAIALSLSACDESTAVQETTSGTVGGISMALPAEILGRVGTDCDSILVTLNGPQDSLRSVARLADTLRFDGLRAGSWTVRAQLFGNDSGRRALRWEGIASTTVEPGLLARVPLVLHRASGSLVLDVQLDDSTIDTAAHRDTTYRDTTSHRDTTVHRDTTHRDTTSPPTRDTLHRDSLQRDTSYAPTDSIQAEGKTAAARLRDSSSTSMHRVSPSEAFSTLCRPLSGTRSKPNLDAAGFAST